MATLSDILEGHGISPAATQTTGLLGLELRARTAREGVEFAAMVDAESGARLGAVIRGERRQSNIMPHLRLMRRMRRYVQLHTHPGSTAFSDGDLDMLLRHEQIRAMVVVGVDRTWYVVSVPDGIKPPPALVAAQALRNELADRLIELRRRVADGADPVVAEREMRHEACRAVADGFNLRYDRHEPSPR